MKRAIIPISIASQDILIQSYNDLDSLYKENKELYNALCISGEAQRMAYSYSRETPCDKDEKTSNTNGIYLSISEDPLAEKEYPKEQRKGQESKKGSKQVLLAANYDAVATSVDHTLKLYGMHRHKTKISFNSKKTTITKALSISHTLVSDAIFIVKSGAKIRLSSSMLDNVYIIAEDGAVVELIDVEFSNSPKECVYLHMGATVGLYENVRFFDVMKRFKIDNATLETVGKLINFNDPSNILEFLETSYVSTIELLEDFVYKGKEIELNQPITFKSNSNEKLTVSIDKLTTSENLKFSEEFDVIANIKMQESIGVEVSLANFKGFLNIEDSENFIISNTLIEKSQGTAIDVKSSSVLLKNSNILNSSKPIRCSYSRFSIDNTLIQNVNELVEFREHEIDEDLLLIQEANSNSVLFVSGSKVVSSLIIKTRLLDKLEVSKTSFINCKKCFDLEQCKDALLDSIESESTDTLMRLKDSKVKISHSTIRIGKEALVVEDSALTLEKVKISNFETAVHINSGIVKSAYSVISKNDVGVKLEGDGCLLEHYKSDFDGNFIRPFFRLPGSDVIDLGEVEELEKCHA